MHKQFCDDIYVTFSLNDQTRWAADASHKIVCTCILVSNMLLDVSHMARHKCFHIYDKGAIFCLSSLLLVFSEIYHWMRSNGLSPQHVVTYAFSVKLETLKIMISQTKVVCIELCTSRLITCFIPNCTEPHRLHYLFNGPLGLWHIETNVQGGGGAYFLGCVYIHKPTENTSTISIHTLEIPQWNRG